MTELKTLKDIKEHINSTVSKKDLRQEAIKQIKRLEVTGMHKQKIDGGFERTIDWIKYFFNIKESDLK
jgi:hypothetical protein